MKITISPAIIRPLLAAALLATSIDCGSQRNPTAASSFAQPPLPTAQPSGSNIVPASNGGVPGVYRADIVMSRSGTATVTLTWFDADYSLQLYVTSGVCADAISLLTAACTILGSTRPGSLPGVVTSAVTGGDMDTIWVLNPDSRPQNVTVDVEID